MGPIQGARVYKLGSLISGILSLGPDPGPLVSGLGTLVACHGALWSLFPSLECLSTPPQKPAGLGPCTK